MSQDWVGINLDRTRSSI